VAIGADRLSELGLDQSLADQLQAPRAEEAEATLAITAAAAAPDTYDPGGLRGRPGS
jgi:hypothetical protein